MNEAELKDLIIEQMIENRKLTELLEQATRPSQKKAEKPTTVRFRESTLKPEYKPTRSQLRATKHSRNNTARNQEIVRRVVAGESGAKVGRAYGLCSNRVGAIVKAETGKTLRQIKAGRAG